jgi:hypothetical protein
MNPVIVHEAAHAAAFLSLGIPVRELHADSPTYGGQCKPDLSLDFDGVAVAVAILAGPMSNGGEPFAWPPRMESRGDEHALANLVKLGKLSESGYQIAIQFVRHLFDEPRFKGLNALLVAALERRDTLTAEDIRQLMGPERIEFYGLADEPGYRDPNPAEKVSTP